MAYILRYDILTKTSITPVIHSFATEAARTRFMQDSMPYAARNVSKYTVEDANEPRQEPTWYNEKRVPTRWWDANKRPHTDRYDLRDEVQS
jgi:hypothetical protein